MEERRMRAADLFAKGVAQAEIARQLGVAHQTVSDWYEKWKTGGKKALRGTGRAGRLPKVTDAELAKVERALRKGPRAHGYGTDLWTLARVSEVIEEVTGVKYHPGHVWRVLRQMGWSRQRPARAATERDDAAIEQWVNERWPRVKKTVLLG
jgi:transposase